MLIPERMAATTLSVLYLIIVGGVCGTYHNNLICPMRGWAGDVVRLSLRLYLLAGPAIHHRYNALAVPRGTDARGFEVVFEFVLVYVV